MLILEKNYKGYVPMTHDKIQLPHGTVIDINSLRKCIPVLENSTRKITLSYENGILDVKADYTSTNEEKLPYTTYGIRIQDSASEKDFITPGKDFGIIKFAEDAELNDDCPASFYSDDFEPDDIGVC